MILSQGLLISLAFTTIIGVLLFFFIRQRTNAVEEKINTLIQFVQTETMKLQNQSNINSGMSVYQSNDSGVVAHKDLIDVSDDDTSDDDSDSYASSVSSSDEQDNEEEPNTTRIVSMNNLEQEHNTNTEDIISLNVIKPDVKTEIDGDLEEELETLSLSDVSENNHETVTEKISDDSLNQDSLNIDYKKLLVGELRNIVENKGLIDNAKKLKKNELLELLENGNEE